MIIIEHNIFLVDSLVRKVHFCNSSWSLIVSLSFSSKKKKNRTLFFQNFVNIRYFAYFLKLSKATDFLLES